MRISIKPFVAFAVLLLAAPVLANSPIPDEDFKDWLDCIRAKLVISDKTGLIKQFTDKKVFACTFYISKEGSPDKLMLVRSTGDTSLDNSAMELIRKSTSLPVCPFNQHRMVILSLKNNAIELSQAGYR